MADETETEQERRKRELLIALFLMLMADTHRHLSEQCALYLSGSVSIHSLSRTLTGSLLGAHTQATYYGRRLAGISAPMTETDQIFAQTVMRTQAPYLTKLLNDLGNGRYPNQEDGTSSAALTQRLSLYAKRLRGTANEAWGLAQPDGTLFRWVLGATEDHCEDCPERAANGPYTIDTLPGSPGDGSTQCLGNCTCEVMSENGERAFPLNG